MDDKGHVVGTEPRKFVLALQGRNLEVEEFGGPPPTQQANTTKKKKAFSKKNVLLFMFYWFVCQDKQDVAKFVHLAKSSPLEAASLLAFKSEADFSRFRKQWKLEGWVSILFYLF